MKLLLSGNEAFARGAYEACVSVAAAYPGTPSTEILETIVQYKNIYAEWSPNEKVALEVALGSALAGGRAPAFPLPELSRDKETVDHRTTTGCNIE